MAAYDATLATKESYAKEIKSLISRFQTQIKPIGRSGRIVDARVPYGRWENRFYWVVEESVRHHLALLERVQEVGSGLRYRFITWISPDMEKMALSKGGGEDLYSVMKSAVKGCPNLP